jgi:hypothetical protein
MEDAADRIWLVVCEDGAGQWQSIVAHSDLEDAEKFAASVFDEYEHVTVMEAILW